MTEVTDLYPINAIMQKLANRRYTFSPLKSISQNILYRSRDHRGSRNRDTFQLPLMKWTEEAPSNHLFPARFDSILKGSMELITFGFVETRTIFTMGQRAFRGPVNSEIKVAWNDIGENSRYSCRGINEIFSKIFLFSFFPFFFPFLHPVPEKFL